MLGALAVDIAGRTEMPLRWRTTGTARRQRIPDSHRRTSRGQRWRGRMCQRVYQMFRLVCPIHLTGDCRTDTPQGGEVVGTAPKSVRQILSDRRRYAYGYAGGFATADREPRRSTIAGALRGEVAPRCTSGSVRKVV